MRIIRSCAIVLLVVGGCAPKPKSVACMTDGECTARGDGYTYCLESHCVKCLSNSMCKDGTTCIDGACQ